MHWLRNGGIMNIEKLKSDLRMRDLFFPECYVKRSVQISDGKLDIDVSRDIVKKTNNEYDVTVSVHIQKEDLEAKVVACATFYIDRPDTSDVDTLIKSNTVAIMFPFIRSQVSLLTTQPGMTPIVLPPRHKMFASL